MNEQHRTTKSHVALERPPFDCIALVLQGGGALGYPSDSRAQQCAWPKPNSNPTGSRAFRLVRSTDVSPDRRSSFGDENRQAAGVLGRDHGPSRPGPPRDVAELLARADRAHGCFNQLKATGSMMQGTPGFFQPRVPPPFFSPDGTIRRLVLHYEHHATARHA